MDTSVRCGGTSATEAISCWLCVSVCQCVRACAPGVCVRVCVAQCVGKRRGSFAYSFLNVYYNVNRGPFFAFAYFSRLRKRV